MTQTVSGDLQKQCGVLVAKGSALLADGHRYIDPGMADFIGSYLLALTFDVEEMAGTESQEREALLLLIVGELHDLVYETQRRIERVKRTLAMDGGDGGPRKGL